MLQSPHHREIAPFAEQIRSVEMLRHGYRRPEVRRRIFEGRSVQTGELRPCDANYFVCMPADRDLLPYYVGVAGKPATPCVVAEYHDCLCAGYSGILGQKRAADCRLHSEHGEVVPGSQPAR